MKKDKNHIDPNWEFSKEKMLAYVNGTLPPEEQHQVEKYLLSHPFEAEAMEGYLENPDALNDLPNLQDELQARITSKQEHGIVPLWRKALPYAAVFLLLITSSILVITFYQQDESFAPLAITSEEAVEFDQEEKPAKPPSPLQDESIGNQSDNQASQLAETGDSESTKEIKLPIKTLYDEEQLAQDELIPFEEELMVSENAVPFEGTIQESDKDSMVRKIAEIEINQKNSSAAISKKAAALASSLAPSAEKNVLKNATTSFISGQVLHAETGEPLPGVNVMIKGTAIGTNTDLDGSFKIDAKPNDVLITNYIGMEQQEFVVSEEEDNKIFLNADVAQLSEVVVTNSETDTEKDKTYSAARPSIGFSDYREYVKDNLQYPEEALKNGTKGRVRLQLSISAAGSITQVEVLKGLGDGCDEEAIRLIKEGPRWEPAKKGDTAVASSKKISVRFKMK